MLLLSCGFENYYSKFSKQWVFGHLLLLWVAFGLGCCCFAWLWGYDNYIPRTKVSGTKVPRTKICGPVLNIIPALLYKEALRYFYSPSMPYLVTLYTVIRNTQGDICQTYCTLHQDTGYILHNTPGYRIYIAQYTRIQDICLLYTSPSPRDGLLSRMPSSA